MRGRSRHQEEAKGSHAQPEVRIWCDRHGAMACNCTYPTKDRWVRAASPSSGPDWEPPLDARCPNCEYPFRFADTDTYRNHRCPISGPEPLRCTNCGNDMTWHEPPRDHPFSPYSGPDLREALELRQPRTAAGRDMLRYESIDAGSGDIEQVRQAIVAIEDEAMALDVERLRQAIFEEDHAHPGKGWVEAVAQRYDASAKPQGGFVKCPLCGDPERVEDVVGGVCLACADAIAFSQHARRASVRVPGYRAED